MDAQLKQQMVGASVFVGLAVVFLPMLLNGRADASSANHMTSTPVTRQALPSDMADQNTLIEPARSEQRSWRVVDDELTSFSETRIDAPSSEQAADSLEAQLAQREARIEADRAARAKQRAEAAAKKRREAARRAAQQRTASSSRRVARSGFAVQVGSYAVRGNAEARVAKLKKAGFKAFVDEAKRSNGPLYQVRVGSVPTRDAAKKLGDRLRVKMGMKDYYITSLK